MAELTPASRATEAFIGQCPTVKITVEGVELKGLLDTGSQVTLMAESMFNEHFSQTRLGKAPLMFKLRAANGLEIPYVGYAILDVEVEGVNIPGRGVVVVKDDDCTQPLIVGMNVVTAYQEIFSKLPRESPRPPQKLGSPWREAFAACQHIEATTAEDGFLGHVRLAGGRPVTVPPNSELLVWARTRLPHYGRDYSALVEASPSAGEVGVARTVGVVRDGKIPVRICNPHPYSLTVGRYQKFGRLYQIDPADVSGPDYVSLSLEEDGVVEVALVHSTPDTGQHSLTEGHLDEVFGRLWQHGLKLRPDKCRLFQQEVKFLGHIVDRSGVRPDPEKVKAVQDWPIPSTIKGVRAFLGLAGYYRRFVAGFANIARPLNSLLVGIPATKRSGTQRIVWTPDCKASFDALKEALTQAPILAYADFNKPFVVYTDASHHGLGAVLAQVQEGRERVIAYASRSLHPSERNDANYSSFKLELLALKWAITEKFKDYLMGAKFTVFTDNNPLAHLQTARLGAVEQRWVAQLASFDYDIKYRSGKNNTNADALSRFPASVIQDDPDTDAPAIASTAAVELTPEGSEWEEAQATDPDIQMVRRYVEKQEKPRKADRQAMSSRGQRLLQHWKRLQLRHNVLCRKVMDNKSHETHYQIICPSSRCQEVWRRVHEAAAHAGIDKTLVSLRKNFYWPGMEGEVRQFHQGCAACSLQKSRVEPKAPLHPVTVSYPLEVIALDFLSLGRTADEFPYILVATDQFTRFAWAISKTFGHNTWLSLCMPIIILSIQPLVTRLLF
uniref:Gypsy retrotransposon integrase-like protein 1 n=1 Tax=Oryzias latipes TaxID=8090 RepID=A0A3B3HUY0_ORYLA